MLLPSPFSLIHDNHQNTPKTMLFSLLSLLLHHQISSNSNSDCLRFCGGVDIPYPFGLTAGCALPVFLLSCNSTTQILTLNISGTHLRILNITNGQLRVSSAPYIATDCAATGRTLTRISLPPDSPYTISGASNRFVAVGCDTVAVVTSGTFTSGCVSLCTGPPGGGATLGCTGAGCCEAGVPEGRRYLTLGAGNMYGYANVSGFDNCSYAFLVERGAFRYSEEDMRGFKRRGEIVMKLDWAIGEGIGCEDECGENAYCIPSVRGRGYLCNCSREFDGNPYLLGPNGCQDVDECLNPLTNPCMEGANCLNRVPGYKCECPFGSTGDGTKHGSGCRKIFHIVEAILGTIVGITVILCCGLWLYFALKQQRFIKLKAQYFRQNGGLLLKQQLSSSARDGSVADCARVFSLEELNHATLNYDTSRILGTGGYGTVYKGILVDGMTVAIKKSKLMDQGQIDQFINELVILTQINHRNVVKLLGCCLEAEVPMLVYEFVPNGTLYHHIHECRGNGQIRWKDRLRIAIETAEAVAYLHSAASMPIIHRDIKSSNILLDESYTAKVSDFGISRLVPLDQTQVPTLVQGTLGYLDPEYFQTSQLTAKSDVYSFGVVLVELLTGQKPVSFERSKEDSNLAMYFLSSLKCRDIREFVDRDMVRDGRVEELSAVAELARKCLLLRGDKRPSMKEVARELCLIASCGSGGEDEGEEGGGGGVEADLMELEGQDSLPPNLSITYDLAR